VRYHGKHCEAWAWVKLKVTVQRLAARKALKAGDLLDGATQTISTDLRPGDDGLETIPEGARAASDVPAGAVLTADRVRIGPAPGASIEVLIQAGALAIEQAPRWSAAPSAASRSVRRCRRRRVSVISTTGG